MKWTSSIVRRGWAAVRWTAGLLTPCLSSPSGHDAVDDSIHGRTGRTGEYKDRWLGGTKKNAKPNAESVWSWVKRFRDRANLLGKKTKATSNVLVNMHNARVLMKLDNYMNSYKNDLMMAMEQLRVDTERRMEGIEIWLDRYTKELRELKEEVSKRQEVMPSTPQQIDDNDHGDDRHRRATDVCDQTTPLNVGQTGETADSETEISIRYMSTTDAGDMWGPRQEATPPMPQQFDDGADNDNDNDQTGVVILPPRAAEESDDTDATSIYESFSDDYGMSSSPSADSLACACPSLSASELEDDNDSVSGSGDGVSAPRSFTDRRSQ